MKIKDSTAPHPGAWLTLSLLALNGLEWPVYEALNRPIGQVHQLGTSVDAMIPFVPAMVLPYLSFYAFPLFSLAWYAAGKLWTAVDRLLLASTLAFAASFAVYATWQTAVVRPVIPADPTWTQALVTHLYASDAPYNCFPSLHTSISAICMIALWPARRLRWVWQVWGGLIVCSTMLVKQHYLADVIGGIVLAAGASYLANKVFPRARIDEEFLATSPDRELNYRL